MISTPYRRLSKKRQSFGEVVMGLFRPGQLDGNAEAQEDPSEEQERTTRELRE